MGQQVIEGMVKVRYKLQDDDKFVSIRITEAQYHNLLEIPVVEQCEIVE